MAKINSNIKERILQLAEKQEGNKQVFFKKVGLKYSNFTGINKNSDIGSKAIAEILVNYPDVNLHWLITGVEKKEEIIKVDSVESPVNISGKKFNKLKIEDKISFIHTDNNQLNEKVEVISGVLAKLLLDVEELFDDKLIKAKEKSKS